MVWILPEDRENPLQGQTWLYTACLGRTQLGGYVDATVSRVSSPQWVRHGIDVPVSQKSPPQWVLPSVDTTNVQIELTSVSYRGYHPCPDRVHLGVS